MLKFVPLLILGFFYTTIHQRDELPISVDGGTISIQNAAFNPVGRYPELTFTLRNGTASAWWVDLEFDIRGVCNGEPQGWSANVSETLGWIGDPRYSWFNLSDEARERVTSAARFVSVLVPVENELRGCTATGIKTRLISAQKATRN